MENYKQELPETRGSCISYFIPNCEDFETHLFLPPVVPKVAY